MADRAGKADHADKFVIHVDGIKYDTTRPAMTGAEIKALAQKDAVYQLFEEQTGNDPDRLIGDDTTVELRNGLHFYTVPPASFGAPWI